MQFIGNTAPFMPPRFAAKLSAMARCCAIQLPFIAVPVCSIAPALLFVLSAEPLPPVISTVPLSPVISTVRSERRNLKAWLKQSIKKSAAFKLPLPRGSGLRNRPKGFYLK